MKKKTSRLTLNRETLRHLQDAATGEAKGASGPMTFPVNEDTLMSWQHTCGSVCDIPTWHC